MTGTDRIRWERIDGTVTSWLGYVGSLKAPLFQILHPVASKPDARTQFHKWALAATFTDEVRYPETAEGAQSALKDEAEDWLEEFAASIGAVFLAPGDQIVNKAALDAFIAYADDTRTSLEQEFCVGDEFKASAARFRAHMDALGIAANPAPAEKEQP